MVVDSSEELCPGQRVRIQSRSDVASATIDVVAPAIIEVADWMPSGWKVKLSTVGSLAEAEGLKGQLLLLESAQESEDSSEFAETVGFLVKDSETGVLVGTLQTVEPLPHDAPDRLWISEPNGEVFPLPAVPEFVANLAWDEKTVFIRRWQEIRQAYGDAD